MPESVNKKKQLIEMISKTQLITCICSYRRGFFSKLVEISRFIEEQ